LLVQSGGPTTGGRRYRSRTATRYYCRSQRFSLV